MSIKKTKLTVALCQLNAELNSERVMSQVLPMVFKYHLSKIAKIAADEDVSVNTLRDDAIRRLEMLTVGFQYLNLLM
jgi:hypothetical protein